MSTLVLVKISIYLRRNLCRNPDGDRAPWCYTTDPSVRWEYCKIERCSSQLPFFHPKPTQSASKPLAPSPTAARPITVPTPVTGLGESYRGLTSKTVMGVTCQAWSSMTPHQHSTFTPVTHPDKGLESNQCRNPDNDVNGPWCYTTDPYKKWDYCQIPDFLYSTLTCLLKWMPSHEIFSYIAIEECIHCSGENYRGKISTTEGGYTCQRWNSEKPHNHGYIPSVIPDKHLEENYCRNPDGEPRPWCFTTSPSKRWDFCSIPRCSELYFSPTHSSQSVISEWPSTVPKLSCATGDGSSYRGTVAVTASGKTCQIWASQYPHIHSRTPEKYPCKGLEKNYCRNPDNERKPWCYTTDPETRWEYCTVPICDAIPHTEEPIITPAEDCYERDGSSYRGVMSETISGKKCQLWTSMEPHAHQKTPQKFPNADLRRNLCRNPDGDRAPWCYTTDPSVRWEYCKIERCSSQLPFFHPKPTQSASKALAPSPTAARPITVPTPVTGLGESYRGPTSKTVMGVTCQAWSSMIPHQHSTFTPVTHPDKGLESNVGPLAHSHSICS
uniref:Kringle domain-containing protein n=1 Tax=Electrophorus electricus TaxID=8005 RepID=A0A4W4FYS0_ELEEL